MKAKKSLGQNFLIDTAVIDKIIEAGEISKKDNVLEVGPGQGFLTRALVCQANKVLAIEKDEELADFCRNSLKADNLEILTGDVLETNWEEVLSQRNFLRNNCLSKVSASVSLRRDGRGKNEQRTEFTELVNEVSSGSGACPPFCWRNEEICQTGNSRYKVIANIPYYITGKILRLFLENSFQPNILVLMVQKEVAERICAKPGKLGILSLSVQYFGKPEIVTIVPREKFNPIPDVDSAVIKIVVSKKNRLEPEMEKKFFRLIKQGFASPRKTLVNNLSASLQKDKQEIEKILEQLGFKGNVRAQELGLGDWKKMINLM